MLNEMKELKLLTMLSNKRLWYSIGILLLSLVFPFVINVKSIGLYSSLYNSIEAMDQGLLIITSFKLVVMNAVRVLPIYMAAFTFIELLQTIYNKKVPNITIMLSLLIIPLQYYIISKVLSIRYDFGITSLFVMISIYLITKIDLSRILFVKKSVFVIMLLIGLQWIDIMPGLSEYGFGRGEVSRDIKMVASFIGADDTMSFSASMFFLIFIVNALMILKFLRDQNAAVIAIEAKSQMEIELKEMQLQSLKARSYEEMQNLVHDLKSPLTAIQALVSFSEMLVENDRVSDYMKKINISVDQLNDMISEILHEQKRNKTTLEELISGVLSQISPLIKEEEIVYHNKVGISSIEVNKIRFSRMLINLINNSLSAIDKKKGQIVINIFDDDKGVILEIIDNGKGIDSENLSKIMDRGFSTKGSSGIGLKYVADVVENHGGEMFIESEALIGTKVTILLDKNEVKYEKNTDH